MRASEPEQCWALAPERVKEGADARRIGAQVSLAVARLGAQIDARPRTIGLHTDHNVVDELEQKRCIPGIDRQLLGILMHDFPTEALGGCNGLLVGAGRILSDVQ